MPTARQAPIGSPPPNPLASVTMSGVMPSCWWAKNAPVRPDPGLHFVEHQQRAVLGRDLACGDQIAGGRDDHAALPHDRLEEHRGGLVVDGGGQRVDVAVRDVGDVAGQRRERLLLGRLPGQRERTHRAAVESAFSAATSFVRPVSRVILNADLVGLGSRVAEEHPGVGSAARCATSASASAMPGSVAYRFDVCPSVLSWR